MNDNLEDDKKTIYTWVVDDFSKLTQPNCRYVALVSVKACVLRIELYPMGTHSYWSSYTDVFVCICTGTGTKRCKLSIMNLDGEEWASTEGFVAYVSRGDPPIFSNPSMKIHRPSILNAKEKVLSNDKLTIRCEVWEYVEPNELSIQKDLVSLINDPIFSDVTCQVGGKEFHLHKAILASRLPYFKAMFTNNLEEAKSGKFKVLDISVEAFEEALKFIYSDKIPDLVQFGIELFEFGDKYQMEQLKNMCEKSLSTKLDIESVIATLLLADLHNAGQLKSKCLNFIKANLDTIQLHEHWHELKKNQKLLLDLYNTIELTVDTVIEALVLADSHEDSVLKDKCVQFIKKKSGIMKKQSALNALKKVNPELFMELLMELIPDNDE